MARWLIGIFIFGILVANCQTTRKLTLPAGPLRRDITGIYKNYKRMETGFGYRYDFRVKIQFADGAYKGSYSIANVGEVNSRGFANYREGVYFDPIYSSHEILFHSNLTLFCGANYKGENGKKITEWADEDFGEPSCATDSELSNMNVQNSEERGAYFRLIGDDELWLGDEELPVKLRKIPVNEIEIID